MRVAAEATVGVVRAAAEAVRVAGATGVGALAAGVRAAAGPVGVAASSRWAARVEGAVGGTVAAVTVVVAATEAGGATGRVEAMGVGARVMVVGWARVVVVDVDRATVAVVGGVTAVMD